MHRSIRNRLATAVVLALAVHATAMARDPSATASEASVGSVAVGGSVVVGGSLVALALAGSAFVTSVDAVGASTVVVLTGATDVASATLRVAGGASLVVGSVVEVVAMGTGCVLMSAGRIVAFVPNEVGRALVHQRSLASTR